ncbi:MAG: hypothetical protein IJA41_01670 [Clostridia bacterium]|nr:hypothetical protein [Clostridia bacterium]
MRNFQEVTAEVFKRSEQRLVAAKRRKRMLLSFGSMAVCVVLVLSVWLFYPNVDRSMDSVDESAKPENLESTASFEDMADDSDQQVRYYYTELKIVPMTVADEAHTAVTEPEKVNRIAETLQDFFARENDGFKGESGISDSVKFPRYKLIFTTFDNAENGYLLEGNLLTENVSGATRSVTLTDTQLEELKALLGL